MNEVETSTEHIGFAQHVKFLFERYQRFTSLLPTGKPVKTKKKTAGKE